MTYKLPSMDRIAEMAAYSPSDDNGVMPASTDEWKAMAASLLEKSQHLVGEIVVGIERDESDELTNQKYIDYSLSAIEKLPAGTKLYAEIPTPDEFS